MKRNAKYWSSNLFVSYKKMPTHELMYENRIDSGINSLKTWKKIISATLRYVSYVLNIV